MPALVPGSFLKQMVCVTKLRADALNVQFAYVIPPNCCPANAPGTAQQVEFFAQKPVPHVDEGLQHGPQSSAHVEHVSRASQIALAAPPEQEDVTACSDEVALSA